MTRVKQSCFIPQVVGVLESDRFGLVMDYADFGCLLDLQEDYAPLSWLMKADLLHGVADGMVYLHAQSILHQDLKASNVLVDEALQPKVSAYLSHIPIKVWLNVANFLHNVLTMDSP